MTTFTKLTVYVGMNEAQACADAIEACEDPAPLAVTAFEDLASGGWVAEAYFDGGTSEMDIAPARAAVAAITGRAVRSSFGAVPDEDWTAKVQRDLAPVKAGRFVVHGSHDRHRVRPAQWAIEIDAGEAFGTAHHATTLGCLEAIDRLSLRGDVFEIADVGCGTGVLAIAAAKAWPNARLVASDNDPIATRIARQNARLNGVGGRIRTITAAGLAHPGLRCRAPYDLIIANILAPPLITLAPAFAKGMADRGVLILSGLLKVQTRKVSGAYQSRGLRRIANIDRGEWTTLILSRSRLQ